MNQTNQEISEKELAVLVNTNSRITLRYTDGPKRVYGKTINSKIILHERIFRNQGTYITSLIFDNCVFNELVDIGDYESAGSVSFENCTFNQSARLELANTSYTNDCVFNSDLTLRTNKKDLTLSNLNVKGELTIIGKLNKLTLNSINKSFEIANQKIVISVELNNLILNEIYAQKLEFSDNYKFEGLLKLTDIKVVEFHIGSITLDTEMEICNCEISKIQIGGIKGDIRKLNICNSKIEQIKIAINQLNRVFISGCSISNLNLTEANQPENILNIEKSTILNLRFDQLYNKGLITLRELQIPVHGTVSFKSTNLGKADFIYCNFAKAGIEFENSK